MSLPSAVVAQGERAEALLQAASARRHGNTEQPAPTQATPAAAPQETPKEPAAPAATATPTPTPPPAPDATLHKLRVLEGKYNAEVPRLASEAKAQRDRADKAEAALAEEKKKQASLPLVTAAEVTEFGEPLVELARKIAREENRAALEENEKLKVKLEEVSAQVKTTAQVGQTLNTQAFFSALDAKKPNWRVVNDTLEFRKWLDGVDPLARRTRQDLLDDAQNGLDADGVAQFFVMYEADIQSRAAPRTEALEAQVTPSTTTGAPVTPDSIKKIWTPALITKFYDDVRRGRIKAEDAGRIELDIQAAQREGRYRPR